jgi:hypothetical protein
MRIAVSTVSALQVWYRKHCNGLWEHHYGVHIETLDNPGWLVKVNLADTELAARDFTSIEENVVDGWPQSGRWMNCFVRDSIWHGAGDENCLEQILSVFLNWCDEAR